MAGAGSVVGYNYTDDGHIGSNQGWMESGINGSHMVGPHHVLFEGNYAFNFDSDKTHGNAIYHTVFRNHLSGKRRSFADQGNVRCAGLGFYSYWHSFVGNVLGLAGEMSGWVYEDPSLRAKSVWKLGYDDWPPYAGDPQIAALTHRHGNFDFLSNTVHWATGYERTLPDSLYLSRKPAFFNAGRGYTWPWWIRPARVACTHCLPRPVTTPGRLSGSRKDRGGNVPAGNGNLRCDGISNPKGRQKVLPANHGVATRQVFIMKSALSVQTFLIGFFWTCSLLTQEMPAAEQKANIPEGKPAFALRSKYLALELSTTQPQLLYLSVDSLGLSQFRPRALRPAPPPPRPTFAMRTGTSLEYRRQGLPQSAPARWTFQLGDHGLMIVSRWREEDPPEPMVLEFDPHQCHATLLGHINSDGRVPLPALLHLPGQGTLPHHRDRLELRIANL